MKNIDDFSLWEEKNTIKENNMKNMDDFFLWEKTYPWLRKITWKNMDDFFSWEKLIHGEGK